MANKVVEILLRARDAASGVMAKVGNAVRNFGDRSREAKAPVEDLGDTAEATGRQSETLSGALSGLTKRLIAFIAAGFGLAKLKQGLTSVLTTGSRFESLNTQLEALTGSSEAADEALEWIKEFTKNTPAQLDDVANAFTRLKAFGLDPMDGTLQALVDQNEKLGGGQERLNGIIIAVGQAWAKQKLQAEETLQLVERGVPVYDLLSKALGITSDQIEDMSRNGELGRDAIRALINEIGSSSLGAASKQMEDTRGLVSNLKDEFVAFLNEISEQGALEYFKNELRDLRDQIKEMAQDGRLQQYAKDISDRIVQAGQAVKQFVSLTVSLSSELIALGKVFIALKFGAMIQNFYGMATAATAAAASTKALTAALVRTGWGAIAVGIGYVAGKVWDLHEANSALSVRQAEVTKYQAETAKIYEELSEKLGVTVKTSHDLRQAVEDGLIVWDEQNRTFERATEAVDELAEAEREYQSELEGIDADIDAQAQALLANAQAAKEAATQLDSMANSTDGLSKSLEGLSANSLNDLVSGFDKAVEDGYIEPLKAVDMESALLGEVFRRLNVDTEIFRSGLSQAGADAIQLFDTLSSRSATTSEELRASFVSALNAIETTKGVTELKNRITELGKEGRLSSADLKNSFADIEIAAESLDKRLQAAKALISDFGGDINTSSTISQLQDVGNAAALAWQEGKLSAEEYLQVMSEVDRKKKELIDTTKKQAEAEREAAAASEEKGDAESKNAVRVVAVRQELAGAAKEEAEALQLARDEVNKSDLAYGYGMSHLVKYFKAVESTAKEYLNANREAQGLAKAVTQVTTDVNTSEQSLQSYKTQLEDAIQNGDRLNNQSLSQLQSALSEVKSRIESINNETRSARSELAGLEGELASLQGDQQKQQQLQYEQRRLDILDKINTAEAEGNREAVANYQKSLDLLSRINSVKQQNIRKTEQETQAQSEQPGSASSPSAQSTTNTQASAPARVVNLQFTGPDGQTATVIAPESEAENVIDILRTSGARTR
ncbi:MULTISPECIES: tape measure protein [unclassified Methylophaga]|jgi:tape measure domain-containing protein|uniref:tape measure protein n=1 Tax=unclassified Methylophaga TaxID=2629249 RepID=UPI000C906354|nr:MULTISPECIES: tape measure protein [unclassified Methylophaga]MAK67512.1 hypothetical protein [Methylophaga sp.]MAY18745.1 hypothetical protein [Methylophaga sp.]|tara:strand:+ start:21964 stop:25002 length:3039 start_codon:yes stop_codon:yes gene_type:complete